MKKVAKPINETKVELDNDELEEARQKFINGGGLVQEDIKHLQEKKEEWLRLQLRIRTDAVDQIDKIIKDRMGVTRTGWILQAIEEKLKRTE